MALTDVQNEFLKMQLANNPEFQSEYFPNIITQGPVGPLYNVDIRRDRPANVYYENLNYGPGSKNELLGNITKRKPREDPSPRSRMPIPRMPRPMPEDLQAIYERYKPKKGAEFRDVNVPYDTPGSKINIKGAPDTKFAYTRPGEMMYEGQPITGGQTSAVYMSPRILEDYGTPVTSPRGEMAPTPDWYKELAGYYGMELPETMDQAHINDLIEGIASHEVSHGVSKKPEFKDITEKATTIDFKKMYPGISQEAIDAIVQAGGGDPYSVMGNQYHQEELYNRAKDLERLKMEHPNTWRTHPMRNLIIQRMRKHPGFKKLPNYPSKYATYKKKIESQVKDYFETVKDAGGVSNINIQKQKIGMPEHLTTYTPPPKKKYVSPARPHGNGGGGPRPDKPGGFTDPGKGSYGPHKADGGLINFYRYGGFI